MLRLGKAEVDALAVADKDPTAEPLEVLPTLGVVLDELEPVGLDRGTGECSEEVVWLWTEMTGSNSTRTVCKRTMARE